MKYKHTKSFTISETIYNRLKDRAKTDKRSISSEVEYILSWYLDHGGQVVQDLREIQKILDARLRGL